MSYEATLRVHFKEVDGAGRLFFTRIFEYCHDVYEDFLSHIGLPLHIHVAERPWIMPVVHTEADYFAPMKLGDEIRVEVEILKLGHRSITWQYHFKSQHLTPLATVRIVHVAMDRHTEMSCPLPEEVRTLLEPWLKEEAPR